MAGMLPGVEAARRRRFHQKSNLFYGSELSPAASGYGACSTRRSSFCLYASSRSSSMERNPISQALCDESRLGAEAREAKKRLDERLQAQWRSETTRSSNGEPRWRSSLQGRPTISLQAAEVPKMKKSGSKRLSKWLKLSWKSSEQEECAVCLEQLKAAPPPQETLMQLPCGHRFHSNCLVPWLEANAQCPCCRMEIPAS